MRKEETSFLYEIVGLWVDLRRARSISLSGKVSPARLRGLGGSVARILACGWVIDVGMLISSDARCQNVRIL